MACCSLLDWLLCVNDLDDYLISTSSLLIFVRIANILCVFCVFFLKNAEAIEREPNAELKNEAFDIRLFNFFFYVLYSEKSDDASLPPHLESEWHLRVRVWAEKECRLESIVLEVGEACEACFCPCVLHCVSCIADHILYARLDCFDTHIF